MRPAEQASCVRSKYSFLRALDAGANRTEARHFLGAGRKQNQDSQVPKKSMTGGGTMAQWQGVFFWGFLVVFGLVMLLETKTVSFVATTTRGSHPRSGCLLQVFLLAGFLQSPLPTRPILGKRTASWAGWLMQHTGFPSLWLVLSFTFCVPAMGQVGWFPS